MSHDLQSSTYIFTIFIRKLCHAQQSLIKLSRQLRVPPFLSDATRTRRKRGSCGFPGPPPSYTMTSWRAVDPWSIWASTSYRTCVARCYAWSLLLLPTQYSHGKYMYRIQYIAMQKSITCTRTAPRALTRPDGCRSCTPRPPCAHSCAQMKRRALQPSNITTNVSRSTPTTQFSDVLSLVMNSFTS